MSLSDTASNLGTAAQISATGTAVLASNFINTSMIGGSSPITTSKSSSLQPSKLYQRWYRIPEPIRFFASGNCGNVCFFFLERMVYYYLCSVPTLPTWMEQYKETISFFVGYILQIGTQHLLHAFLVYGLHSINTRQKYINTLLGQASAYSFALVGSTLLNLVLIQAGMEKNLAFVLTMGLFACVNYFVVGWIVRQSSSSSLPTPTMNKKTVTKLTAVTKIKKSTSNRSIHVLRGGDGRGWFQRNRLQDDSSFVMFDDIAPVVVLQNDK